MAAASCLHSEDQFLCSICLDVFIDPVSTPCGHNYCKNCITKHWTINDEYLCPLCKMVYCTRPELHVNTFISEMVAQFQQSAQQEASRRSKQQAAKPGEVPCDVCTGTKLKALKSCLVCLVSYCETHLEPHLTAARLKRHQLIDPVENLENRTCAEHDKPLVLFCMTDQTCVCTFCSVLQHKTHDVVPLKDEYEEKKAELGRTKAEIQQMILERQLKIQKIEHSVELSDKDADREIAEGVQIFTSLKEVVDRGLSEFINTIEESQKEKEKQAEAFIKELEEEISDLMNRRTEVEHLSRSEDHLHLLQSVQSLSAAPPTKDWTDVHVHPSHEGTVVRAVAQLEETLSHEMKKLLLEAELKRVQQFAVDVSLAPDTATPDLILPYDEQEATHGDVRNNPEGFSKFSCVLGEQSFSSGRFYYEVQVIEKTDWDLGVAQESINREDALRPKNGYWTICLRNGNEFKANDEPSICLSLESHPQKVGVFVDYEEGLVSFYNVGTAALIYSFTGCSFSRKLFPFFSPCLVLLPPSGEGDGGQGRMPEGEVADLDTQRAEVAALLKSQLRKGDTWYLVDRNWFKQWKKYVGYDSWDKKLMGDQKVYPGPVDNSGLLRDGDAFSIKEHLIDNLDYILLPTEGWDKLVSWYGRTEGQEPIARRVVEQGLFVKHCRVEVYLTEFKLCVHSNMDNVVTRSFSKADTIATIEQEMRRLFRIPDEKETRMWNWYLGNSFEPLNKLNSTVKDAGLFQGQTLVIEEQNEDGSWPRGSTAP